MVLAKWVREKGGVEEVRRAVSGMTPTQIANQNAELALAALSKAKPLVAAFTAPAELQPDSEAINEFSVALVRREHDGQSTIVFGSANQSIVFKLLATAGKRLAMQNIAEREVDEARVRKSTRAVIVADAAKSTKTA